MMMVECIPFFFSSVVSSSVYSSLLYFVGFLFLFVVCSMLIMDLAVAFVCLSSAQYQRQNQKNPFQPNAYMFLGRDVMAKNKRSSNNNNNNNEVKRNVEC